MNNTEEKNILEKLYNEGLSNLKNNKTKSAIKKFVEILLYRPNHSETLNLLSITYHKILNYDKALNYINEAIKSKPNEIGFHINLGLSLIHI